MDLTTRETLERGVAAHKAGDFPEAERLYKSILSETPDHSDANHNLGVLAVGVGKVDLSLPYFKAALEKDHKQGQYWLSYIDALIKLGQLDNAHSVLEQGRGIGLQGDQVDRLASQLQRSKLEKISSSFDIRDKAPSKEQIDLLVSLNEKGHLQDALVLGNNLSRQFPDNPMVPNIIGILYRKLGRIPEAVESFRKVIELKPDAIAAYNNLGNALQDQKKYENSINAYIQANIPTF